MMPAIGAIFAEGYSPVERAQKDFEELKKESMKLLQQFPKLARTENGKKKVQEAMHRQAAGEPTFLDVVEQAARGMFPTHQDAFKRQTGLALAELLKDRVETLQSAAAKSSKARAAQLTEIAQTLEQKIADTNRDLFELAAKPKPRNPFLPE